MKKHNLVSHYYYMVKINVAISTILFERTCSDKLIIVTYKDSSKGSVFVLAFYLIMIPKPTPNGQQC